MGGEVSVSKWSNFRLAGVDLKIAAIYNATFYMISFITVTVSILLAAREKQYISSNWLFG